ncbi:hypothetical protein [Poritiphilus flavus]|uniref:Uncharacterized protein n=1 Tax=Poritiphilus flavus TaxID=2697053 RepID=A0A6L9EAS6_9FLAO|nr:hypothetical protein [Poritiphilus flavus]NAS11867.1 hypothetical protein [Poritiphilus flavus]
MRNLLSGLLLLVIFCSCSKSDDSNVSPPQFDYENLSAIFYVEGNSAPPVVDWHGDIGQFGLQGSNQGVDINPQTGVISWDKTLPLGVSEIQVIAFNNGGISSKMISIENMFEGNFSGSSTLELTTRDLDLNFSQNGSGLLISYGLVTREVPGTWNMEENQVSGEYPNPDEMLTYWIEGELIDSKVGPKIEGKFSVGNQFAGSVGTFAVTLKAQ